ncbi:hypothetical protein B5807_08353 [Epicoccum nigrum]|uniref:Uncharacterized protein n=1 Tax=Epicoccum nigrum TaxID=105696 RepID=A0A1Y2LUC2_EPING|nr:hypothetical protein B5807_08353 [Epicoccum nigrum]
MHEELTKQRFDMSTLPFHSTAHPSLFHPLILPSFLRSFPLSPTHPPTHPQKIRNSQHAPLKHAGPDHHPGDDPTGHPDRPNRDAGPRAADGPRPGGTLQHVRERHPRGPRAPLRHHQRVTRAQHQHLAHAQQAAVGRGAHEAERRAGDAHHDRLGEVERGQGGKVHAEAQQAEALQEVCFARGGGAQLGQEGGEQEGQEGGDVCEEGVQAGEVGGVGGVEVVQRGEGEGVQGEEEEERGEEGALGGGCEGGGDEAAAAAAVELDRLQRGLVGLRFSRRALDGLRGLAFGGVLGLVSGRALGGSRRRRGGLRRRVGPPALHPQRNGGDAEGHGDQHGAWQVGADADEAVRLDEQVEEEALVQVLEQVVQAAEQALDGLAQAHLVVPAVPHGAQRNGVDVVGDEGAVRPRCVAQPLAHHPPQHGAQALLVRVPVVEHALDGNANAHLARRDLHGRVEQVEVGQLAVDAVVLDVQLVVAVAPGARGVVDGDGGLQRAALDVQALDAALVVAVVVRVDPRLGASGAVARHQEDDVLAPQAPALEVARQREHQRHPRRVGLVAAVRPRADEHDGLGGVGARALQDRVDVLAGDGAVRDVVGVLLRCDLEVVGAEHVGELRGASAKYQPSAPACISTGGIPLLHRPLVQRPHLLAICAEDIVLAAAKVRVHLARQQRVLGHIRLARVVVQRQDQQPSNADDDAQGRQVGRDLEDAGVAPERQQRGWPAVSLGYVCVTQQAVLQFAAVRG